MKTLTKERARMPILVSDKTDFQIKVVIFDKEGCYMMIKGSIYQDTTFITYIHLTTELQIV